METRHITVRMPREVEAELQTLKRMKAQMLIYIVEDAVLSNSLVKVPWKDVISKTILMRAPIHGKAKKMSQDLGLDFSRYVSYTIHGYYAKAKVEFNQYIQELPECIKLLKAVKQDVSRANDFLSEHRGPSNWLMYANEKINKEIHYLDKQYRDLVKLEVK